MHKTVAVAAALLGLAGEGVAVAVSSPGPPRWNELAVGAVICAYAAVGVLILWHRPDNPVGRLAVEMVLIWGPGQALVALGARALHADLRDRAGALESVIGSAMRGLPWLVLVLWLPLVFPDGRGPQTRLRRRSRRVAAATLTCFSVTALFSPTLTDIRFSRVDNPLGLPQVMLVPMGGLAAVSLLLGLAALGLDIGCLVQQYRLGGPLSRQQTLLFGLAFLPPVAGFAASATDSAGPWVFAVGTLPLPLVLAAVVLQRRLYDLPLALNRSLTYGALSLLFALLYAVTVGGVGAMVQQRGAVWLSWVAAGVVAVSFAPLREALQRAANRVTYGQWAQPREVLSRTRARLADAGELDTLLASLVDDLAEGLRLGYVELTDRSGRVLACSGEPAATTDGLPLTAYGEDVGRLVWTRRVLRESDRALLVDLAAQLGDVVHAGGLVTSVRQAQERLVLAREEERRRLRRDLHDGLGPALAGLTLQVDTVRNQVGARTPPVEGDAADASLLRLRTGIQETVLDVRRIVEGLRPPALDDVGLVEAVRLLADGSVVPAEVASDPLPRLPAAVEVAAYRVVQEALTNAARHARAARVQVCLQSGPDGLVVEVRDDGTGELRPRSDGIGLGSMRERAEEIGGSFSVVATPGRGTVVRVCLPLAARTGHAS